MNTMIPALLCVSTLATGLAAQEVRRPVDLSLEGVDVPSSLSSRALDLGLSLPPSIGMVLELFCFPRMEDQASASCLLASSVPTFGMLFPYPGVNNTFVPRAFAGGGYGNIASGADATISGGLFNTASGFRATVPGGRGNVASGNYSFAAGRSATASHNGSFVWGDRHTGSVKTSSAPDEFSVYCSGGARFFSNTAATAGVALAPGAGSWTMISDRNAKENIEPVDARAVLEQVARIPLSTWNYKDQSDSVRHMGPMAQDFYAAFGLGLGNTTIDAIDPDGVSLAAIQGLHAELEERLAEKNAEIEALRSSQADLRSELESVRAEVIELLREGEDR